MSKYESDVKADNARLRAELTRLGDEIQRGTRELEQSQYRERTALRERDGEREEREKVSAFKRQRDEEYEVVLRERDEARESLETSRRQLHTVRAARDIVQEARERAEADCAAMREVLGEVATALEDKDCRLQAPSKQLVDALRSAMDRAHAAATRALQGVVSPGFALLERLRAAEDECENGRQIAVALNAFCVREVFGGDGASVSVVVGRLLKHWHAAVAVVEAARPYRAIAFDPTAGCVANEDEQSFVDALAAYDALGATGEAVEP